MKKINLVLLILSLLISNACIHHMQPVSNPGLFGKWELRGSIISQTEYKTYQPGNDTIFQFNRDSTYINYIGGKVLTGKFHTKDIKQSGTDFEGIIIFENLDYGYNIRLNGNKLSLGLICPDCGSDDYIKLPNKN